MPQADALSQRQDQVAPPVLRVLLVGDPARDEFQTPQEALARLACVTSCRDFPAARERLQTGDSDFHWIALVQDFSGQFDAGELDALRRLAPLARVVCLQGPWCEGERRSGTPLPGTLRLPWNLLAPRLARDVARLEQGQCPAWGQPLTTEEEERWLHDGPELPTQLTGLVAVHSDVAEIEDWLRAACHFCALDAVRLAAPEGAGDARPRAILWDAAGFDDTEQRALRAASLAAPGVPIIVCLDFPRPETQQRALRAGAACILPKPVLLADLRDCLHRILATPD